VRNVAEMGDCNVCKIFPATDARLNFITTAEEPLKITQDWNL